MSAATARRMRLVVDILIAASFIALLATPIAWGQVHEWIGIAAFALTVIHIVLSRKAVGRLARKHHIGAFATLALDALLLACLVGLAASAFVLSEHALSWAPAVPGSWWARVIHLLCSYWGFALAFVHVGLHLRVMTGARRHAILDWVGRAAFVILGAFGALSFIDSGMWSYMTLINQFVFVDPDESLAWQLLQYASMGVLVAGTSHYVASACRVLARRRKAKVFRIPTGAGRLAFRGRGQTEKKRKESDMEYTNLGSSGIEVSRICLGCMGFGDPYNGQHSWTISEEETRGVVKAALDAGINFFDTAIAYQNGTSEQFVGRALRDFAKRDDYVVATKFLPRTVEEMEAGVSGQLHIERSLDQSLKNLGLDHIDLYIYHMWDYHTPFEEIMEGLDNAVKSGKTRAIGIANCFAWQLAKANFFAQQHGMAEFVSVQNHYNLIAREEEREMIPFCVSEGIALTPYSALAGGRLAKRPGETSKRLEKDAYAKFKYDATADVDAEVIARVAEVADRCGVAMSEVALAWLLRRVDSPVVGATRVGQIEGMARAVDLKLSDEEAAYLEEAYVPHALAGVMAQNGKQKGGNIV